jgi:glycine hydroxymethyltransferase
MINHTLLQADHEVARIIDAEVKRQQTTLMMIPSENYASRATMAAAGSVLTNKYAEGYPGRRYYGGCQNMDAVEDLARQRAKKLFGCDHANVQPHSGAQANAAVYLAVLRPGDTLLSLSLAHGGHLSHGLKVNMTGLLFNVVQYEVDPQTEQVDYAQIRRMAAEHKPKLIISGASAYPRTLDFDKFSEIAHEIDAVHMADIAHIAGMVAVGLHPSPIPSSDFVTTTTHKTLRGPRGGMIMCREELAKKCDSRVFPGSQGGPLMHCIAGKAVAFGEALKPEFKQYQQQILDNAQALAEALVSLGNRLVSGGTDTHLMLLDLRPAYPDVTGKQAEEWLEQAGIVVNKNMIPFDERKPTQTSGLRIGTPALTTRGLKEAEMNTIAGWIDRVLRAQGDPAVIEQVHGDVLAMCDQFPLP